MNLNYKASNIRKAEKSNGTSLFEALNELTTTPSVSALMFLLEAGGASEDEIDALVEEKGLTEAVTVALEALAESGFLGKKISTAEFRKAMNSAAQSANTNISGNTGETKKA